ncbi:MAG: hypothetical protein KAW61_04645 [candidate division Zixibacteria bacterium]|nr:hypothetical protein [candidate division Zixibacteria bacterium]
MKKVKVFLAIMFIAAFSVVNVSLLFSEAEATLPANQTKTFSAGSWIIQGGETVGCSCPRDKGPCVCEYNNAS